MNMEEFSKLSTRGFTQDQYKVIERVYTFHPSISEVEGKKQIAYLYSTFGIRIIHDMLATAEDNALIESESQKLIDRRRRLIECR